MQQLVALLQLHQPAQPSQLQEWGRQLDCAQTWSLAARSCGARFTGACLQPHLRCCSGTTVRSLQHAGVQAGLRAASRVQNWGLLKPPQATNSVVAHCLHPPPLPLCLM